MTADPSPARLLEQSAVLAEELGRHLPVLEEHARFLQIDPLAGREWYDLFRQKLIPQLGADAWLVVAVVGGTNIGKSVVFNHLAGGYASASSPLASGTRHPVCLVPEGFDRSHQLSDIFPDFTLREWSQAAEPLQETEGNPLYWRTAAHLPPRLLILDTPDIDSDARVNWARADAVRRSADVLIAVLTQQKYNDAAVKEFFRRAGAEDKSVLVVFNQCLMPEDEQYWPIWLRTFCQETGITPDGVYIAPGDRRAAEELRLPFFRRPWPAPSDSEGSAAAADCSPRILADELSHLRFHEIRMRTLLGSLQLLIDPRRGAPSYLSEVELVSAELASTAERMSAETVLRIRNWPAPTNSSVVAEVRTWWQARQQGWARTINNVYNAVGTGVMWPVRAARKAMQGPPVPPLQDFRQREWSAILQVVEELFDRLQWMADSGHRILKPRIEQVLQGSSRSQLIARLKSLHEDIDFERELADVVDQEMQKFQQDSPELFGFYRQLHTASAAVRPVTSVVLFSLGFGPAGEVVAPFVAGAAAQAMVHVVADVAGGATTALAGEAAVSRAAGAGAGLLQAWFQQLHASFTRRRAEWLTEFIHRELLGTLPEELRTAAALPQSDTWRDVRRVLNEMNLLLNQSREDAISATPGLAFTTHD